MTTTFELRKRHRLCIRQAIGTGELAAIKAATRAARSELTTLQEVLAGQDRDAFGELLSRMYLAGTSERDLVAQSGWSTKTVRDLLSRVDTPKRPRGRAPKLTHAEVVELYERWGQGETLRELAAEVGCVPSTLHHRFTPIRVERFRAAQQAKKDTP